MASVVGMLHGMFEQVDEDVIVTVLEINGGNVERTIDQLLQIQGCAPFSRSPHIDLAMLALFYAGISY